MSHGDEYLAAQRRAIAARARGDYESERVELDKLALMDLGSVTDQVARVLRRHEHRNADVCRCGADMSEYVSSEAKRFSPRKHRAHIAQTLVDAGLLAPGQECWCGHAKHDHSARGCRVCLSYQDGVWRHEHAEDTLARRENDLHRQLDSARAWAVHWQQEADQADKIRRETAATALQVAREYDDLAARNTALSTLLRGMARRSVENRQKWHERADRVPCAVTGTAQVFLADNGEVKWKRADDEIHVARELLDDPDISGTLLSRYRLGVCCPANRSTVHATRIDEAF